MDAHYDREGRDNFANSNIYYSLFVDAGKSYSNTFLQLSADNEGVVDSGKLLSFSVKSTEPLIVITYLVKLSANKLINFIFTGYSAWNCNIKSRSTNKWRFSYYYF